MTQYELPVRIGGTLLQTPDESLSRVERRRMSYVERLAVVLTRRLWAGSGMESVDPERLAVAVGTGLGGADALVDAVDTMRDKGYRHVSPLSVPMVMPNGAAAWSGIEVGAQAGVFTPVSACSSGSEAVVQAWRLIATGEADVVVAGGVEGRIDAVPIASFSMMRAMSTRNDDPESASRPFDADRDGFVFGEAGALMIVEEEEHARARGAEIQARILGAAITSDGFHIVAPEPNGLGVERAMKKAIASAGLTSGDIDHVNAHATSTSVGDLAEARAIARQCPRASVYAPKSALGHSIGAVGALETIICALTLKNSVVPPTLNFHRADPGVDLDVVAGVPRNSRMDVAITNSVGFGGHNVSLVLAR